MKGTPGGYFLGLLGLCLTILTSVTGRDTTNMPPELAVIGSPNWILPTTFSSSLGDCDAGHDVVVSPGEYLKPDETQKLPHISIANLMMSYESNTNSKSKYVVLMVDPDYNTTSPTYVILHTLYANVTAQGQLDTSAEIAKYLAPQPQPVGSTHNYTLLLFRQPDINFEIPAKYASYIATNADTPYNRINFPLPQFLNDTSLGKPIAANWFKEKAINSTGTSISHPVTSSAAVKSCSSPSTSVIASVTKPTTGISATQTASATALATNVHAGLAISLHNARSVGFLTAFGFVATLMNAL